MSEGCLKILSRMTKTKDFIAKLPQAASCRDSKSKDQIKGQSGKAPKREILESGDSDDSGDSPVFTSIDSLPPNKVRHCCIYFLKKVKSYQLSIMFLLSVV